MKSKNIASTPSAARAPELVTVAQAAQALGVTPLTVRRWIKDGDLPHYKLGRHKRSGVRLDMKEVFEHFRHEARSDA